MLEPPPLGSDNASVGPTSAPVSPISPSPNSPTSPAGSGKPDDQSAPTFSDAASSAGGSIEQSVPVSSSTGGGSSGEHSAPVFSDAGSQTAPPKITSSAGGYIDQPTQGSPVPGRFEIKVRARTTASNAAFVVFTFKLAPNTTLEALFGVIEDEKMVPFMFRMVGFAYFGCRDFISQLIIQWIRKGIMLYQPTATANLTDSDNDDQSTVRATSRSPNDVDRGVWDPEYVNQFDKRLKYIQEA